MNTELSLLYEKLYSVVGKLLKAHQDNVDTRFRSNDFKDKEKQLFYDLKTAHKKTTEVIEKKQIELFS